jgi:DNA-binding NarL/FixJ family response regulator
LPDESAPYLTDGDVGPSEGVSARSQTARSQTSPLAATRVLVIDERPLMRSGVGGLLRRAGIDVVGEVSGPHAAVTAAQDAHPDVLLLNLKASGMGGADAVRVLASMAAPVVLLADPDDIELLGALAAGACGALVEEAPTHEIAAALRAAAHGDSVFSPAIARALMRRLRLLGDVRPPQLTPREQDVLELLARGWDNARIAATLYLSIGTVKHHISSILIKLHVENRIQAAVRAVQHGLIGR